MLRDYKSRLGLPPSRMEYLIKKNLLSLESDLLETQSMLHDLKQQYEELLSQEELDWEEILDVYNEIERAKEGIKFLEYHKYFLFPGKESMKEKEHNQKDLSSF